MANDGINCYVIDIFDRQELNLDRSGVGDFGKFVVNLAKYNLSAEQINIDNRPSNEVSANDITGSVGPARFFHVDGGRHNAAVQDDMALAEKALADGGVITLDDVFRPEWPDVTAGYFLHSAAENSALVPFAIGFNKLYLCHQQYRAAYQNSLKGDSFLQMYFAKRYDSWAGPLLVFQRYHLPEWPFWRKVSHYLMHSHPKFAYALYKRKLLDR